MKESTKKCNRVNSTVQRDKTFKEKHDENGINKVVTSGKNHTQLSQVSNLFMGIKNILPHGVVGHAFNYSTWKSETGRFLRLNYPGP